MPLPQTRQLTDAAGFGWLVTVDRGRLVLVRPADGTRIEFADPTELRWLGLQTHRAAVEHDLAVQHEAAKASADRRQRRKLAGEQLGDRARVFVEPPEPALNLDPLIVGTAVAKVAPA